MKVTIENKKGLNKDLKVLIDKETMISYMDEKYEEIKSTVNLKGFRPGKVPREVLKRQFGKAIFGEVLDKVLKETSTMVEVSFNTLSRTSPNIALPNCLFKTSLGTFPGRKPFRLTVLLISSYFSSI